MLASAPPSCSPRVGAPRPPATVRPRPRAAAGAAAGVGGRPLGGGSGAAGRRLRRRRAGVGAPRPRSVAAMTAVAAAAANGGPAVADAPGFVALPTAGGPTPPPGGGGAGPPPVPPSSVLAPGGLVGVEHAASGARVLFFAAPGPLVSAHAVVATEPVGDGGHPHCLEHLIFLGSEPPPRRGGTSTPSPPGASRRAPTRGRRPTTRPTR